MFRFSHAIVITLACVALTGLSACKPGAAGRADAQGDLVASGWLNFRLSEFDLAERDFSAALAGAPKDGEARLMALFGLANVWNLRRPGEDPEKGRAFYRQVMGEAPGHDLAIWSELAMARMLHVVPVGQDPDYAAVRKAYEAIIAKHGAHLAAKEATIYLNAMLVATLLEEPTRQAVANLRVFIASNSTREFVAPAWSLLAVSYTTLGRPQERLEAEIQALQLGEIDPANPFNEFAWAYWNIATIAEFEVGDFATARDYYARLIAEYPADIRVFPSQQAIARMDRVEQALREGREPTL